MSSLSHNLPSINYNSNTESIIPPSSSTLELNNKEPQNMFQTTTSISATTDPLSNPNIKENDDITTTNNINNNNNTNIQSNAIPNINYNNLSIDNFELEELQKIQNDGGIPLHQPTASEIHHMLSEFPNDIINDDKQINHKSNNINTPNNNSNSKSINEETEGETETVHLQTSPTDSLVKSKSVHYDDSLNTTMNNINNYSNALVTTNSNSNFNSNNNNVNNYNNNNNNNNNTTNNNNNSNINNDSNNNHNNNNNNIDVNNIEDTSQKIQAYAMLDFDSFTFYVQTMQILLGRMVEGDPLTDALDIHLGNQKAISRRHAKIFYNFGNQRFELSVLGRNGAFVDGNFIEKGITVPLSDGTKIQIGETEFAFVLPNRDKDGNPKNINTNNTTNTSNTATDQIENLDNLVANFDVIKNDIQNDKLLIPKDQNLLALLDTDKQREIEIEKEIGKVLARENNEIDNNQLDNNSKNSKKKSTTKSKTNKSDSTEPKAKAKPKRQPKAKKKVYTLEEIPEQYRTKPNLPYSILITDCLRQKGTERGMSLSEIYKGIQDLYPYYFYCPDGWQSSVRHNLSLNKSFRKISKEGKGWLWGINEEVAAEKDRLRKKQLENAKAKGKSSSTSSASSSSTSSKQATKQSQPSLHIHNPTQKDPLEDSNSNNTETQKSSAISSSTNKIVNNSQQIVKREINPTTDKINQNKTNNNDKNKQNISSTTTAKTTNDNNSNNKSNMSDSTKRALAYLQKELISLTKSRKMYDRATSTEILTKALAMTISQVDQAAKNFAIKGFPLVILIDKNPGHVTKILTAALNAATLQVCKQKGLTPHLPPKTNQQQHQPQQSQQQGKKSIKTENKSGSTNMINSAAKSNVISNVPIMHIKKESQESTHQENRSESTIDNKHPSIASTTDNNNNNKNNTIDINVETKKEKKLESSQSSISQRSLDKSTSRQQNPTKPGTGPVVYQFSKPGTKPSFKPAIKPISGSSVKSIGSMGTTSPSNQLTNVKPIKQVRLGGIAGTGIIKPQFYNKGKSSIPSSLSPSPLSSSNNIEKHKESISEEEEIRRSIAKFGKPTMKSVLESTLSTSEDKSIANVNEVKKVNDQKIGSIVEDDKRSEPVSKDENEVTKEKNPIVNNNAEEKNSVQKTLKDVTPDNRLNATTSFEKEKPNQVIKEIIPEKENNETNSDTTIEKNIEKQTTDTTGQEDLPEKAKKLGTDNAEEKHDKLEETGKIENGDTDKGEKDDKKNNVDEEGDDELDDELHMMLADLEQEDEPSETPDSKKRTIDEVKETETTDDVNIESKRVKTE